VFANKAVGSGNQKSHTDTSKNPDFIPTDATTSHSTKLSKDDSQVVGYAALRKKFLACI
jgi:hypothetical protein